MQDERIGLRSEDLRAALQQAVEGRPARLGDLLARHGGLPGPRPNLTLAAAFGDAIAREGKRARRVLEELRQTQAKPDEARTFLPIAAAYGYVARLASDRGDAWAGVLEICADDRAPVRIGLAGALSAWVGREMGALDELVARGAEWIEIEDRDHRYAACAIVLDVIAAGLLRGLRDPEPTLAWVTRVIAEISDAPRAAERSPARRRLLAALPLAVAEIAASLRGANDGIAWLTARLGEARHPDVRVAMEHAIERLRRGACAQSTATIDALRAALASSAKPPRDPSRIREGTGRGKKGRARH